MSIIEGLRRIAKENREAKKDQILHKIDLAQNKIEKKEETIAQNNKDIAGAIFDERKKTIERIEERVRAVTFEITVEEQRAQPKRIQERIAPRKEDNEEHQKEIDRLEAQIRELEAELADLG